MRVSRDIARTNGAKGVAKLDAFTPEDEYAEGLSWSHPDDTLLS